MPWHQARQQVPMLRLSGTSLTEPATLGLRHGVAAQCVFAHQSGVFELLLDGRERCRRRRVSCLLGNFTGEAHDESEAVLQVVQLDLRHKPFPIEIRIPPDDPGQRLTESRLEIGRPQRGEEELRRVDPTSSREMRESRISQRTKGVRQRLRITRPGGRFHREFGRRYDEVTLELLGEALRHRATVILQQREVCLRDAQARRRSLLGPTLPLARLT